MNSNLLEVSGLHVSAGEKEILHGVDLTVGKDETHVLMGPNGTGKSTLGYAITGNPEYTVTAGKIVFDGEDITRLPVNEAIDASYAERDLNVGFSGGEKKKAEILQMLMLEPKLAILDETDSGLDVDAVRTVSKGVQLYRERVHGSLLIITHSTRILEALTVDAAHIMEQGVIVKNGDASLVDTINENGFGGIRAD